MLSTKKSKTFTHTVRQYFNIFIAELWYAIQGVTSLAFIASKGIAAYVFWFSTDSITLKIVAVILAISTAADAHELSSKKPRAIIK
jgi:hypothetical protein